MIRRLQAYKPPIYTLLCRRKKCESHCVTNGFASKDEAFQPQEAWFRNYSKRQVDPGAGGVTESFVKRIL